MGHLRQKLDTRPKDVTMADAIWATAILNIGFDVMDGKILPPEPPSDKRSVDAEKHLAWIKSASDEELRAKYDQYVATVASTYHTKETAAQDKHDACKKALDDVCRWQPPDELKGLKSAVTLILHYAPPPHYELIKTDVKKVVDKFENWVYYSKLNAEMDVISSKQFYVEECKRYAHKLDMYNKLKASVPIPPELDGSICAKP